MKKLVLLLFISVNLMYLSGCNKNNNSVKPAQVSTWTFKGIVDTGMAMSVGNNTIFTYWVNGQQTSITLTFYSAILQNHTFSAVDTLNDSTDCIISLNDGNGHLYHSAGRSNDKVNETFSNRVIVFDFNNISVISGTDTQLVSANLRFPSVY